MSRFLYIACCISVVSALKINVPEQPELLRWSESYGTPLLYNATCTGPHNCPVKNHQKNSVYIELSQKDFIPIMSKFTNSMVQSSFTDLIFSFINICARKKGDTRGLEKRKTTDGGPELCHGDDPEVAWNMFEIFPDSMGPNFKQMAQAKTLWISVGAWANDETFWFFDKCEEEDCRIGARRLKAFMDQYHITGLDVDFEATSIGGFDKLIKYMKEQGVTKFSAAPYVHMAPAKGSDLDLANQKANVMGAHWQYCQFKKYDIEPLMNIQYYEGGFAGDIQRVNEDIERETSAEFLCNGQMMKIPMSSVVAGMGVAEGRSASSSYSGWQCSSASFQSCQAFVEQVDNRIGGVFTWRIEALHEMDNTLWIKYLPHHYFAKTRLPPLHAGSASKMLLIK